MKEYLRGRKFTVDKTLYAPQMGSWNTMNNTSSTSESVLWRNAGISAHQVFFMQKINSDA